MIQQRSQLYRRSDLPPANSLRALLTFPPERHTDLVRRPAGLISFPGKLYPAPDQSRKKLTKLLLNVTIERSLGPVQVVMSPENTVGDLIKAAVKIYVREKRRPLVTETDPHRFELHYSQFSLDCLKADEKLIKLGSRNFFMCSKPADHALSVIPSCLDEAKNTTNSLFPLTKLMDFLL